MQEFSIGWGTLCQLTTASFAHATLWQENEALRRRIHLRPLFSMLLVFAILVTQEAQMLVPQLGLIAVSVVLPTYIVGRISTARRKAKIERKKVERIERRSRKSQGQEETALAYDGGQ